MNQRELMEILGVRSASLSELLAKLEQNGLVSRTRDERDRRNFVVAITEAGLAAADEGKEEKESANTVLAMLEKPERQTLGELLIKIILTLEEEFPDGPPYRKRHECGPCEGHPRGCHGHGPHHPLRERGQQGGREEDSTRPTPSGDGKPTREGK